MKYECKNCEDVFNESQAHSSLDDEDFDGKEYYICPNCKSEDLEETNLELSDFYKK